GLDAHRVLPVRPVPVADLERDGTAERLAAPDTRQDLGAILLDGHATAAAVAELPPRQIGREIVGGQGQPRRDTVDHNGEGGTMRFTSCQKPQHQPAILSKKPQFPGKSWADSGGIERVHLLHGPVCDGASCAAGSWRWSRRVCAREERACICWARYRRF